MNIRFRHIVLENFKNHKSLEVQFEDLTNIAGRNGAGKSSIGDAITWILFGTDVMGFSKFDPKPSTDQEAETVVRLLISIDGVDILLGRSQKKTAKYYINEVPEKATKFNELVSQYFNKDLFLSLFNPIYFSSQSWQDQRSLLLSYVREPLNKEVLEQLTTYKAKELEPLLKKYSLDDIEKIHRDSFNKSDKAFERASERVITLQEQLEKVQIEKLDVEEVNKQIEQLIKQRDELDEQNHIRYEANNKRHRIEAQLEQIKANIMKQKSVVESSLKEVIKDTCSTCGQPLDEESIKKVEEKKKERTAVEVEKGKQMVAAKKGLEEELSELPGHYEINREELLKLDDQVMELKSKLYPLSQRKQLETELNDAKENAQTLRKAKLDSQSIIDSIKDFKAKRSELMVKKVDDLFTTISVRLYEQLKNGEEKATFEIEWNGRPYSKLSTAERIKCGLELIEVLSKQSDVVAPTFVDNAESILHFTAPVGQLIVARVVDSELTIKTDSLKEEKVNE
ncbi:AAA family ATPase [Bacillus sp. BGMRC 2118]|nr:AAA family ATPase [Bacillus sp. BGMRC 2118]